MSSPLADACPAPLQLSEVKVPSKMKEPSAQRILLLNCSIPLPQPLFALSENGNPGSSQLPLWLRRVLPRHQVLTLGTETPPRKHFILQPEMAKATQGLRGLDPGHLQPQRTVPLCLSECKNSPGEVEHRPCTSPQLVQLV